MSNSQDGVTLALSRDELLRVLDWVHGCTRDLSKEDEALAARFAALRGTALSDVNVLADTVRVGRVILRTPMPKATGGRPPVTPLPDVNAAANIFNNAFNELSTPQGDGAALTMDGIPNPDDDLIQWCREHKDTDWRSVWPSSSGAAMIARLINAYVLLMATDLNEESLEHAIVAIEGFKTEDQLRERDTAYLLTAIMRTLGIRELVVRAEHVHEANLFAIERYRDLTSGDLKFTIKRTNTP